MATEQSQFPNFFSGSKTGASTKARFGFSCGLRPGGRGWSGCKEARCEGGEGSSPKDFVYGELASVMLGRKIEVIQEKRKVLLVGGRQAVRNLCGAATSSG